MECNVRALNRRRVTSRWLAAVTIATLCMVVDATGAVAQEAGTIRGLVVAPGGEPVEGVLVILEDTERRAESGSDGRFELRGLPTATYRLLARRVGYAPSAVEVLLSRNAGASVEVVLAPRAVRLGQLTVIGSAEDLAEVREQIRLIPGSVRLIEPEELRRTRQANFKDVLRFVPGVYIQPRFGGADESQLSVRGSGLRNNFHLRGVNVLVNGMPYRNADGFTDFESIELLTTENVQVYKGGNSLRYGGSTLGGGINFETKTGYNSRPLQAFFQGGAYGFLKGQVSSGAVIDDFDYYVSYAHTQMDGFRSFADQGRDRVNTHVGYRLSDRVDARAFHFYANVREDLPGSLTAAEFASSPRMADANNVTNQYGRDYTLHHVGVQLRAQLAPAHRLEIAPYGQFRDIVHPIFRVLDQTSSDLGLEVRYEATGSIGDHSNRFALGVQPAFGTTDNRHFENNAGVSGALQKDQKDKAGGVGVYLEEVFGLTPTLSAAIGFRYDRVFREAEDFFLSDGDQTDKRWFSALMPKVGLIVELPDVQGQVFMNASRSYEPPLLLELNSLTVPGFIDLEAQDAWQFEVGTRGRTAGWSWDLAAYDIELRNEIINANVQPFPGAPFTVPTYRNAERTRHLGFEAGFGYTPLGSQMLGFRMSYTFGRYTFVEDTQFDGNEIPGAPEHVLQGELVLRHPSGFSLTPNIEWVPDSYYLDSQNTVSTDGWTVLGLRGEVVIPRARTAVFFELRNLTDEVYSPAASVDNSAGRYFQPADGRSLYVGTRWQL